MSYIDSVNVGGTPYKIQETSYITPSLSSTAYTAALANFTLAVGATVQAKFATTNPANATLNVNSTGAKNIFYNNASITVSQFKVNHVYTLVYDGTQWQVVGDIDTDTTYSLSGLGGIGTITASGTAPLTLSGSKSGTTYTLTGSVADASASASGIINTDAQTFAGVKTFDNGIHIYGTISTQGTGSTTGTMYPGGAYHSGHNSIVLHGDTSGVSGIGFTSEKATKSGTTTNINSSSDRAFIQYHAYGVTPAAEGTAPTLATSGESGVLVLGVGNDATDTIRLQAPGTAGILHQIGATAYPIPHTTNTNGSVGGTTTPVYVEAGVIKAGTALGTASQKAESYFVKAITSTDNAIVRFDGTNGQVQKSGITIDDNDNIYAGSNRLLNNKTVAGQGELLLTALGFKTGYPVYTDPTFLSGNNSVNIYNNSGGGTVVHTHDTYANLEIPSPGTNSNYIIKIETTGTASPGCGGFVQTISARANAQFVQIFRALVPSGRHLLTASNTMGTNYKDEWLTSNEGTGKWEWYARRVICGQEGSMSSGGHVYIDGSIPVTWYLASCNVYDITKTQYDGLRVRESDGVADYNNGTITTFGYSTAGMTSTSWLGSWDGYKLRAISPANAIKSAIGTSAIGGSTTPIYWDGSVFQTGTTLSDGAYKSILNNTSAGALGWNSGGNTNANNLRLINVNTLAYWNGAYSGTTSNLEYYKGGKFGTMAKETATDYAKLASPAFTGTPTAPTAANGTNTTQIATTAFVMSQFKYNDAMMYKGVVNSNNDLPTTHYQGWTYKVATAGTYAGIVCEIGDMIICNTDGTSANNAHWNVIQTNLDGAVTSSSTSVTDNTVARFDGTTGKIIQKSGVSIDDSNNLTVPGTALKITNTSGAKFILMGNQDSSGANKPVILEAANGTLYIGNGTDWSANNGGTLSTALYMAADRKIGIGTTSPDTLLTINGDAKATKFIGTLQGNADTATTATNLANNPSIQTSGTTQITITAGGKTSSAYTVPYATSAGSATSAGKWTTARTLTIGNKSQTVDGSGNVTWSLADIGAATSGHNHSGTYVPNTTGANDINTIYNTGIYNITSGSLTNGPTGYGYGQLLVMSYRKHTGNITTDWATQIYAHLGSGNNGNTLYYRTSNASTWQTWQMAAHTDAGTAKGGAKKPIYINAKGEIQEGDALKNLAYKDSLTYSDVGAAAADHGTHVTTATVQSALGISSSGSGSKALTEKGTFVTFGTSNLTIGNTSSTAMAGNTTVTNVSFTAASDNAEYPILMKNSTGGTTTAAGAKFNTGITINPSNETITANEFIGNLKGNNIIPTLQKTYTGNYYGTGDNYDSTSFFFISLKPDTWYKPWKIKFKIRSYCPTHTECDSVTYGLYTGRLGSYSYANWNERNDSYAHYYTSVRTLNQTGFNAGLSHALGICLRYASNYTNTGWPRTFEVEIYDYEGCTVSLLDTPLLWANWPNAANNYNGWSVPDAVTRGLCETNDATGNNDDRTLQDIMYFRFKSGAAGIGRYTLLMEESTGVYSSLTTTFPSSNTPLTTLTMNTGVKYKLGRIIYFNQGANRAGNTNIGNDNQYFTSYSLIDGRYTFQYAAGALTGYKPFYMVGTLDADGFFTIDPAATAWSQDLPTANTNKVYVFLGTVYPDTNAYRIALELDHPIYTFTDGALKQINPGNISGKAASVALSGVTGADDLQAIEALTGTSGLLKKTAANTWTLDTSSYVTSSGVTSVATGAGLTGGTITGTGTIKADLTSETKLTNAAADGTETSGRVYPVRLDKNGKLAVNVPWTDTSHYSAYLYAGANNATAHAAVSSGTNIYLCLRENNSQRSAVQIKQGNNMTISSDANGIITFASTDTNNAVTHTVKTTTKYYVTGTETATTSTGGDTFDTGIYATTEAGQLNATSYKINENVTLQYNTIDSALEFVFG